MFLNFVNFAFYLIGIGMVVFYFMLMLLVAVIIVVVIADDIRLKFIKLKGKLGYGTKKILLDKTKNRLF